MRDFDFAPLFRSAIGFDRVMDLMQHAPPLDAGDNYPPYNIERPGEDEYRITMAVAGFSPDELSVTVRDGKLVVSGEKKGEDGSEYLHHGIATRAFERRFELAPYIKVTSASHNNGLLSVELQREIPEEMKPRRIPIAAPGIERPALEPQAA